MRGGKLVSKHLAPPLAHDRRPNEGIMPDIGEFQTLDGVHITGREALREYQRRTGLEQIGNDSIAGRHDGGDFVGRAHEELPPAKEAVIEVYNRLKDSM